MKKNYRGINLFLFSILLLCSFSCKTSKEKITTEEAIINTPAQSGTISSIDIPSPGFFWLLRPWKKGTLATMDGKARFAEISFKGKSGMTITQLINFPEEPIDRTFVTAPESGICITQMRGMFFIADIVNKKTKKIIPLATWRFDELNPIILDQKNGIICFRYNASSGYEKQPRYNIIYDIKNDKVLYESPEEGEENSLLCPFTTEWVFCVKYNKKVKQEYFLYNWKTKETINNELTKKLYNIDYKAVISPNENTNIKEGYLFNEIPIPGKIYNKNVKITWDENYENVKVIPLDYLIPEGKWLYSFFISADGKWAASFVGGYKGYYDEILNKRVFFHLDSRYPNGISMPIFTDEYYETPKRFESFVEHPVYGMCFAGEKRIEDKKGNEKLYLSLYKMDDVLTEINRQWEKSD